MTTLSYADAMSEALDRLRGVGYEHGTVLVNHAPMAAEALATLGHADDVPRWVEYNLGVRQYHAHPTPRWSLSPDDESDWRSALGSFDRVADWSAMFVRELSARPWEDVLRTWWPRLLPGMSGVMTHGVIRTAHAVRSLAHAPQDDGLQRTELARGLAYWAARYSAQDGQEGAPHPDEPPAGGPDEGAGAIAALDELIADSSGHYVQATGGHPVPLIHAITGPAAVRLACQYLPADLLWPSYHAARRSSERLRGYYGRASNGADAQPERPAEEAVVAGAIGLGDEHAIKLAEVAIRHNALLPDERYLAAAHAANKRVGRFLESNTYYG
jgi:hypothetical protein